jgi:hypothetical protein
MRRFSPRLLVALPLLALVLILAGCEDPQLHSQSAAQQDLIGPVRINSAIEACDNPNPIDPNCTASGGVDQLLMGYRVPSSAEAPESFTSTSGVPATFHKSSSYSDELERLAPAATGETWVGYISDPLEVPAATGHQKVSVAPGFGVPSSAAGSPFTYATVVGWRDNSVVTDATRDVVCDATGLVNQSDSGSTNCQTDASSDGTVDIDLATLPLNDLTMAAGAAPTVHAGDTATIPFVATLLGPGLTSGSFALAAASPLTGATATPGSSTLAPSHGDNAVSATLKIPATAAAGDYPVTLTATNGGQTRQATGTVHVVALPGLVVSLGARSVTVKNGVASLRVSCPADSVDPCAGTVSLATAGKVLVAKKHKARKRTLRLGSGQFTLAPGASGTAAVDLTDAALKALARTGKLSAKATFVMTDRAGKASRSVSRVVLRGAKARKK